MSSQEFQGFYMGTYQRTVRFLIPLTDSVSEAEDLAQDAYARALDRWATLRDQNPEAWTRVVAVNLARSRHRRAVVAAKHAWRFVSGSDARPSEHPTAHSDLRLDMTAALRRLPWRQRTTLVMHYVGDLTISDIARALGTTEGTVKSDLHRGRTRLAALMEVAQP